MEGDTKSGPSKKRKANLKGKTVEKKSKTSKRVDPEGEQGKKENQKRVSAGHGYEVNNRHANQLKSLLSLMSPTPRSCVMRITDEKSEVLGRRLCCRLYMEWIKKEDQYVLWGSSREEKLTIKFDFHGGFQENANEWDVKNPLLVFSEGFDHGSGWDNVKLLLQRLFGHSDREETAEEYDYMFAFTRSGDILHFRIFKIHNKATLDMTNLMLEGMTPSYTLKPLEVHHAAEIESESTKYVFVDENRLMFELNRNFCLVSHHVTLDDGACHPVVPHVLDHPQSPKIMLPVCGIKHEWLGFNTTCKEYFERYIVSKLEEVPGTGPVPTSAAAQIRTYTVPSAAPLSYEQIAIPMKVFSRGLIVCVGETHKTSACYSDFDESNIFLRRGRVAILGVRLLPYSTAQAERNFHAAHGIISHRITGTKSPDVEAVLNLLVNNPIENLDFIANNFAWMDPAKRDNLLDDLHEEFTDLTADVQQTVIKNLPDLDTYLDKFANNWLLTCIITDKLSKTYTGTLEDLKTHMKRKARELQKNAVGPSDKLTDQTEDLVMALWNGRRYVKGIRNSYVHLPATAREKKTGIELTGEKVDLIVSSELAAACYYIQKNVPMAFPNEKRASYERFHSYFASVDNIEFNPDDCKEAARDTSRVNDPRDTHQT